MLSQDQMDRMYKATQMWENGQITMQCTYDLISMIRNESGNSTQDFLMWVNTGEFTSDYCKSFETVKENEKRTWFTVPNRGRLVDYP